MNLNSISAVSTLFICITCFSCSSQSENNGNKMEGNHLINETSPYLLQHAHNPVDWYPWGEEALAKAKEEDKMILVSIGYSACHWCHVMEHESFEDDSVAAIMNENFVCIKVDREERPDIDQVYMSAVQLMSGRGGWPLNCVALPDGRPIFGGTYFPKDQWIETLLKISQVYKTERSKLEEYADKLAKGIKEADFITVNETDGISESLINDAMDKWSLQLDNKWGGPNRAPKFPLPNNYDFLMYYAHHTGDKKLLDHVLLTLDMMSTRGMYDLVGGGFARYSTDSTWKIPHFEKMLYDNSQLVSLYADAYKLTGNENYKDVVYQTLEFVERELTGSSGNFYSALDADSDGEEGKFYVWSLDELNEIFDNDLTTVKKMFLIDEEGYWEHDNYILMLNKKQVDELPEKERERIISKLLKVRSSRIKPGLDDKTLTSWNAMMSRAYLDAYFAFGNKEFLNKSLTNTKFILKNLSNHNGGLNHSWKNGESKINGYLEDYAFVIDLLITTYEATLDIKWLNKAKELTEYVNKYFTAENSSMFYFSSSEDQGLITRKMETQDNVIPASNSVMAKNLFLLGTYFEISEWREHSLNMLRDISSGIPQYGSAYSNWLILAMWHQEGFREIVVCSTDAVSEVREFRKNYLPGVLMAGTTDAEYLPLLENRMVRGENMIYVCENSSCLLPVDNVKDALKLLR
jgi:uncharacterized protein